MNESTYNSRKAQTSKMLIEHPDKIPVIIVPFNSSSNSYKLPQSKFLVPKQYTFHDLIFVLRKKLRLSSKESLFISIGDTSFPNLSRSMHSIYIESKSDDGFLYVQYSSEPVWGNN